MAGPRSAKGRIDALRHRLRDAETWLGWYRDDPQSWRLPHVLAACDALARSVDLFLTTDHPTGRRPKEQDEEAIVNEQEQ